MKTAKRALYAGSFDPLTLGHLDIIQRVAPLYDEVHVLVANSLAKTYLFSLEERVALIEENLKDLKNIKVVGHAGLLVDYAKEKDIPIVVRGLRAISDFEYEFAMAQMNKKLAPDIETMIIFTRPEFSYVASRMVKEVASHGGSLSQLVPANVDRALQNKRSKGLL